VQTLERPADRSDARLVASIAEALGAYRCCVTRRGQHERTKSHVVKQASPSELSNLMSMSTHHRIPDPSPQALVLAQIADEDKPMPSDEDVKRLAREHHLPDTEAEALVRFARAVSKIAEE
jgi:hypothetical protein